MDEHDARLTPEGQVTVPGNVRDHLGLEPGDELVFVRLPDGDIRLRKKHPGFSGLREIVRRARASGERDDSDASDPIGLLIVEDDERTKSGHSA